MYTYEKPDNLVDLWEDSLKKHAKNNLFGVTRKDRSAVDWITYEEIAKRVDNLRSGLAGVGVEKGDTVGIISGNRPEWMICAFASYGRGARGSLFSSVTQKMAKPVIAPKWTICTGQAQRIHIVMLIGLCKVSPKHA